MHEAFEGKKLDLVTFRYAQEDGNVSNFEASPNRHLVDDRKLLERLYRQRAGEVIECWPRPFVQVRKIQPSL